MDMGGAKMSQIIGKRLGYDLNPNSPSVDGKDSSAKDKNNKPLNNKQQKGLFTDMQDMVLQVIRPKSQTPAAKSPQAAAAPITTTTTTVAPPTTTTTTQPPPSTPPVPPPAPVEKGAWDTFTGAVGDFVDGTIKVTTNVVNATGEALVAAKDTVVTVGTQAIQKVSEKATELEKSAEEYIKNTDTYKQITAYFDKKEAQEKNFKLYMSKIGIYPRVLVDGNTEVKGVDLTTITMNPVYNDQLVFQSLKAGYNTVNAEANNTISALLPVKFSFTVHGVSGIKRGDKFKVMGIPRQYEENGFFQVTSVKHTIDGMIWKTEVEGGLRLNK
jgi:hypothetical protein